MWANKVRELDENSVEEEQPTKKALFEKNFIEA